jgi:hypothetical protein
MCLAMERALSHTSPERLARMIVQKQSSIEPVRSWMLNDAKNVIFIEQVTSATIWDTQGSLLRTIIMAQGKRGHRRMLKMFDLMAAKITNPEQVILEEQFGGIFIE